MSLRSDWWTHAKTEGLSPLQRDLLLQCGAANIAGIIERSPGAFAQRSGGATTSKDVERSLRSLEKKGILRWWPELEIVWWVESADEQARNNAKAWKAVMAVVSNQPREVQKAFGDRYLGATKGGTTKYRDTAAYRASLDAVVRSGSGSGSETGSGSESLTLELPEVAPSPRRDLVKELWDWFEDQCAKHGYATKRSGLSAPRRKKIRLLVAHISATLMVNELDALKSQREHLQYRLSQAAGEEQTRKRIHSMTPWREPWWSWWFAWVHEPGQLKANGTPSKQSNKLRELAAEIRAEQERST